MTFAWLAQIASLSPVNLTIENATRVATDNPLDLRYRALFPRKETDSIRLSSITEVDFRPTGGRREWNAQGREIPEKVGPRREFEMVPINPTHHIDERQMTLLRESGVEELIRRGIIKSVTTWPPALADAVERQNEADAFTAWFTGAITVMDPKTGTTVSVSLGFDQATSYPTAGTAWNDPSEDAYLNFLAGLQAAKDKFGSVSAARARSAVWAAIVAAAPVSLAGATLTFAGVQERVRAEGFDNVVLIKDDRTHHPFTDGGSTTTSGVKYVPAGLIGYQPGDVRIGNTHVAPVTRAYDFLSGANRSLANGCCIWHSEKNDGKTLLIEAQENSINMPEESRVYVEDTGVTS